MADACRDSPSSVGTTHRQNASSEGHFKMLHPQWGWSWCVLMLRLQALDCINYTGKLYIYIYSDYPTVHTRKKIEKPPMQRGPTAVLGVQTWQELLYLRRGHSKMLSDADATQPPSGGKSTMLWRAWRTPDLSDQGVTTIVRYRGYLCRNAPNNVWWEN